MLTIFLHKKVKTLMFNTTTSPEYYPITAPQTQNSFLVSLTVILISEIGDKTFIIAAIMAMSHPRIVILSGALTALLLMTVISAVLGSLSSKIISKELTQFLAALLFFGFGLKMLFEAKSMNGKETQEEIDEVTVELFEKSARGSEVNLERGVKEESGVWNIISIFFSPVFIQVFLTNLDVCFNLFGRMGRS